MLGHYVLNKNKEPEHMKFAMWMIIRYLDAVMSGGLPAEMRAAMEKMFYKHLAPAARHMGIFMDAIYRGA